jgi:cytochrome bd-type quinol oxidase subunit 1
MVGAADRLRGWWIVGVVRLRASSSGEVVRLRGWGVEEVGRQGWLIEEVGRQGWLIEEVGRQGWGIEEEGRRGLSSGWESGHHHLFGRTPTFCFLAGARSFSRH